MRRTKLKGMSGGLLGGVWVVPVPDFSPDRKLERATVSLPRRVWRELEDIAKGTGGAMNRNQVLAELLEAALTEYRRRQEAK